MSVTIRDLMTDPALFGDQFGGESWANWRTLLAGFYGLDLAEDELPHWQALTARQDAPEAAHDELWLTIGRRAGKSNSAGLLAVFEACFFDYSDRLAPGEVATVAVLAADRKQARSVFRYISGLLNENAMLRRLIVRENTETIELANRCVIEVTTASYRATRGYTFACVIADEIAFWRSSEDSANPDSEILNALRPGLATLGGKLIALSSPYSRRGELWEAYRRYYGHQGPVLVAQAATRTMNPALPQSVIDRAYERDAVSASAEYGAEFRNDIEAFITRELVDACARVQPLMLPRQAGITYAAFVDVAGGGADEFTLGISHKEGQRIVIDAIHAERGDPAAITARYAEILKQYGINTVTGDRYAAEWPVQEFRKHGVTMKPSDKNRSELYLEFLPMLQTGAVELPPDTKALNQLASLERRTSRAGRDSIDHAPGGHDDRANALAGAAWLARDANRMPVVTIKMN